MNFFDDNVDMQILLYNKLKISKVSILSLKSNILKMGVVIALIFILLPVIAAEDVDDSVYADSPDQSANLKTSDVPSDTLTVDDTNDDEVDDFEEGDDEGEDIAVDATAEGSADLELTITASTSSVKVGDTLTFFIEVINNGPDTAKNVVVNDMILGDLLYMGDLASHGTYNFFEGIWEVGDLEAGEYAMLIVVYKVIGDGPILIMAEASSDTYDPYIDNNFAICLVDFEGDGGNDEVPEPETMPAAGNPVALAVLALMSIVGVSLKRKF